MTHRFSNSSKQERQFLAKIQVNLDSQNKDGDEAKVEERMDHDRCAAGLEVPELDEPVATRQLKQQARRQQHEQHHRHENGAPIRHHLL